MCEVYRAVAGTLQALRFKHTRRLKPTVFAVNKKTQRRCLRADAVDSVFWRLVESSAAVIAVVRAADTARTDSPRRTKRLAMLVWTGRKFFVIGNALAKRLLVGGSEGLRVLPKISRFAPGFLRSMFGGVSGAHSRVICMVQWHCLSPSLGGCCSVKIIALFKNIVKDARKFKSRCKTS